METRRLRLLEIMEGEAENEASGVVFDALTAEWCELIRARDEYTRYQCGRENALYQFEKVRILCEFIRTEHTI